METAQESPAQAEPIRHDPTPRRAAGQSGTCPNKRSDRHYKLANPMDNTGGLQYHLDTGWREINAKEDSERVIGAQVDPVSGRISWRGQVFIWIPKDEYLEMMNAQQEVMRTREERRKAKGGILGVRDALGRFASQINTGSEEPEEALGKAPKHLAKTILPEGE